MARVDEVGGIADHGPVDAQALVWAAGGGALLLEAAGEPLQPDLAGAGHLPLGSLAGRRFSLLVVLAINREAAAPSQVDDSVGRGLRTSATYKVVTAFPAHRSRVENFCCSADLFINWIGFFLGRRKLTTHSLFRTVFSLLGLALF